ncbi:MYND Zn-finger protein [Rhizoctonia solani]|uniref:MYND Zn-finger protein n=1 Tax=Rhizoctonia solani TaxID=456999 RepID=A0A8H8SRF2_9AGAM|nr:MYND Zn-finger protein [Rhizoctonia solani]QRW15671.1 MYND Zn-finger protein [Rhizoctonia solani]
MEHPDWGPTQSQYSATFSSRMEEAFTRYMATKEFISYAPRDFISLGLLETALAAGENMHKTGYLGGTGVFSLLVTTLRAYVKRHPGDVFNNYFGFLCIRHLIRMVCIGVLSETSSLDKFLRALEPSLSWNYVTELLSHVVTDFMYQTSATDSSITNTVDFASLRGPIFVGDGGLNQESADYLVHLLWTSRKSIVPLRSKGLLPGLPALIFVLAEITRRPTNSSDSQKPWVQLQDLSLRCYLVNASDADRKALRQISLWIHNILHPPGRPGSNLRPDYVPFDNEDGCMIGQAYIDLLSPPIDPSFVTTMHIFINISLVLLRWVFIMLTKPSPRVPALDSLIPNAFNAALERLGAEIDQESNSAMSLITRVSLWYYIADICRQIQWFHENTVALDSREALMTKLYDADFHGLLELRPLLFGGHVFGSPLHASNVMWDFFLGAIDQVSNFFKSAPNISDMQIQSTAAQWLKVLNHMFYRHASLIPCLTPRDILDDSMEAWTTLRTSSLSLPWYMAENPKRKWYAKGVLERGIATGGAKAYTGY